MTKSFPLFRDVIENPEFQAIPATFKLLYWLLVSEYNLDGKFSKDDSWLAAVLNCTPKTIQSARKKLKEMELIKTQISSGGIVYSEVKFAIVPKAEKAKGSYFTWMNRYQFEDVLYYASSAKGKRFNHGDIVTYVALTYWRYRTRNTDNEFYISKSKLRELTGYADAPQSVSKLYDAYVFNSDDDEDAEHLFEFEDRHRKLYFYGWNISADPENNEGNASNAADMIADIERRAKKMRNEKRQAKGQQKTVARNRKREQAFLGQLSKLNVTPEILPQVFREIYSLVNDRQCTISKKHSEDLIEAGKREPVKTAEAIIKYLLDGSKGHSVDAFLKKLKAVELFE